MYVVNEQLYIRKSRASARERTYTVPSVCVRIYFWTLRSCFPYTHAATDNCKQYTYETRAHMHQHTNTHTSDSVSDIIFCRNKSMTFARQRSPDVCTICVSASVCVCNACPYIISSRWLFVVSSFVYVCVPE